jgi:predicted ester cyclase
MDTPNKALIRRYLAEVVNTGAVERTAEFVAAPDVETAQQHVRGVRSTYPDLHVTVVCQIGEGDLVASRVVGRATHGGEWLGIRPTNKPVVMDAVNIDRVVDGKIVEHWGVANAFEALFQVGALRPAPDAGAAGRDGQA